MNMTQQKFNVPEKIRPQGLCLNCGKCMPIGGNLTNEEVLENRELVRGPKTAWDKIPEDCGFAGWQFRERERQKHLVRKVKEELYELSFMSEENFITIHGFEKSVRERQLRESIQPWLAFGATSW